jgi:glyoxylase-like metal-dependent hydrolase (beta-lactamase superfamily II)
LPYNIYMAPAEITAFNIGFLSADLSNWFGLADAHPYAKRTDRLLMQCYLISLAERLVLVDAPAYEFPGDDSMLLPEYKGRSAAGLLSESGVSPEAITDVVITHPHLDHTLGLASPVDHPTRPVFPNARHYLSARDWNPGVADEMEMRPLEVLYNAGILTLVEGEYDLGDGLTILPAPGETPGHQILWLKTAKTEAYFIGDLFHHPLEFQELGRHPVWADKQALETSKVMVAERAASSGAQIFFTHIEGVYRVEHSSDEPGRYNFNIERQKK